MFESEDAFLDYLSPMPFGMKAVEARFPTLRESMAHTSHQCLSA